MLRKLKDLKGYTIHGRDKDLGKIKDFYFDQHHFIIRYVVVDTGNWLQNQQTLISTEAFEDINFEDEEISVDLNSEELENGPSIKTNKPVSKLNEEKVANHFDWPVYWTGTYPAGGPAVQTGSIMREKKLDYDELTDEKKQSKEDELESNLRSFNEVRKYHIQAKDDEFGHLEDIFVDDENWVIRYLLVDTRNFWPGKDVLIAPEWLQSISWNQQKLYVNKTKDEIKSAPEYKEEKFEQVVDRNYEDKLYDHYNENRYW